VFFFSFLIGSDEVRAQMTPVCPMSDLLDEGRIIWSFGKFRCFLLDKSSLKSLDHGLLPPSPKLEES